MTSQAHRLLEREDSSSTFAEGDTDDIAPLHLRAAFSLSDGRGLLGEPPSPRTIAPMADTAWAIASTANVAITLLTAIYYFPSAYTVLGKTLGTRYWDSPDSRDWALLTCALLALVACAVSRVLLLACRQLTVLKISLGGFALTFTVAVLLLPQSVKFLGATVIAMECTLFFCFVGLPPERLAFAAELLKVASRAVTSTPNLICWALCMTIIRYMWVAVGIIAYIGSMSAFTTRTIHSTTHATPDCTGPWLWEALSCKCDAIEFSYCSYTTPGAALLYVWMASVSWGSSVAANIVAATVAGSVASRWSSPDNTGAVRKSFHHVMRSALGSLSKVAAIDCLFKPLHFLVASFSNASWTADFVMICLRFIVSYALLYPVVFVSVYRLNFTEAVRHARAIVRAHGWTLLMSDSMIAAGFVFLSLAIAATPYSVWVLYMGDIYLGAPPSCVPGLVLVCTVVVTCATLEVVMYASKAVFVCLMQVPEAEWTEHHDCSPHNELYKAWRELQLPHPATRGANGTVQA